MADPESHTVDDSKLKMDHAPLVKVKVASLEEDEDVMYTHRAKLFRMGEDDGAKVWKERGLGDVKILKHRETGKYRCIMRVEKTLKLCCNHTINPRTRMESNVGSMKSWVFHAHDFADGELVEEMFAIRFKTEAIAAEFRDAYHAAGDAMGELAAAGGGGSAGSGGGSSATLPEADSLDAIYGAAGADAARERYAAVAARFTEAFGSAPAFFVRAPGRVNLIGEHIDYCGYGVLPIALASQDVIVAVGSSGDAVAAGEEGDAAVSVVNIDAAAFADGNFPLAPGADVDGAAGWLRYVHAGYKAAFEAAGDSAATRAQLQLAISGSVPVAAGLSSSSALCLASALAAMRGNGLSLPLASMAEAVASAERYVGMEGGGMDQAVSALATAGQALFVEFSPLRTTAVPLPADVRVVVADSLVASPKADTATEYYNRRVVECRLAAAVLAKLHSGVEDLSTIRTLADAHKAAGWEDMGPALMETLPEESYTLAAVSALLGVEAASLFDDMPAAAAVLAAGGEFMLRNRAAHVFSERERVLSFRTAAEGEPSAETAAQLGSLMNDSHTSLAAWYDCSCAELDSLVELARDAGALGARLTGAGWGGAIVALVRAEEADEFVAKLTSSYYADKGLDEAALKKALFVTPAGSGAAAFTGEL